MVRSLKFKPSLITITSDDKWSFLFCRKMAGKEQYNYTFGSLVPDEVDHSDSVPSYPIDYRQFSGVTQHCVQFIKSPNFQTVSQVHGSQMSFGSNVLDQHVSSASSDTSRNNNEQTIYRGSSSSNHGKFDTQKAIVKIETDRLVKLETYTDQSDENVCHEMNTTVTVSQEKLDIKREEDAEEDHNKESNDCDQEKMNNIEDQESEGEDSDNSTIDDGDGEKVKEIQSKKKKKSVVQKVPKLAVKEEDLTCKECQKKLKSFRAVERHMNLHTGKYKCHVCEKICNSEFSLKAHVKVHQGFQGDQVCNVCDKVFYDKSSLNKHTLSVHMGIKNFECRFCSMSFFAKKTFEEHERVHTGERPFKCRQCPKTYKRIGDLNHHIRLHKGKVKKSNSFKQIVIYHITILAL